MILQCMRWESPSRWYEVWVIKDLFDDLTIVRKWGGLHAKQKSQMTEVAENLQAIKKRLREISRDRQKHHYRMVWVEQVQAI